ncbi:hypothetical protein N7466_009395 [Penicillium verhagenii]|uniref:uncharacterized protein n=1 Tax=Penicillium verhagenii TaxID=1562060 RepID=UPI0025458640|nr:uncharacterized protein N7466_009395 [Penicillium verhagenii]KAJ5921069.1 hypothetical protein N7466_009395 [Penicillium verhagenii]
MSAAKPEIVLIPGAWHYPESYAKFRTALESQGLLVHIPRLTSVNDERPPTQDLYTDTTAIREFVTGLADEGRKLFVLMHSYGGQVGTNALAGLGTEARKHLGLSGGVVELVYLCAHVLSEGQAIFKVIEERGHGEIIPFMFNYAEDGTCLPADPRSLTGPEISEEEFQSYLATLGRWNSKTFGQPLEHCAWRDIPMSYIHALNDAILPLAYQRAFVQGVEATVTGRQVRTFDMETGHCPTITAPEELAHIMQQIIAGSSV